MKRALTLFAIAFFLIALASIGWSQPTTPINNPRLTGTGLVTGTLTPSGSGVITASVQQTLDLLSTTRGTIIYRGAGGWTVLAPGTANFVLATGGPGADPYWITQGGGVPGSGTVTDVTIVTANGISGSVATSTTTPAITLVLGAITPSSIVASGAITGSNLSGTNTGDQTSVTGNAGTATALQTARTINGTSFDGTANITVTAAAGTLTGGTLASGVTASSLLSAAGGSFGTAAFTPATNYEPALGNPSVTGYVLSSTTAGVRSWVAQSGGGGTPGGSDTQVQFNDSGAFGGDSGLVFNKTTNALTALGAITGSNLSGTNTGDQTSVTGNAGTATALETARTINGVSFDGTANITVAAAAGTLSGSTLASGVTASSLLSAAGGTFGTAAFVDASTANIPDSTNRRYVTDAQLVVIGNTSGTNTGDQTSVTGNAGTATALQTARTINGVSFDGTANITVPAAGSTLTDTVPITKGGTGQITAGAGFDALTVQGSDVASGTTTNIGAATGAYINVTGTTTITAFDTAAAGRLRVLKFGGILTLTHDGTALILPGAANITTAAGDTAVFASLGSGNWRCVNYTRAAAPPVSGTNTGDQTAVTGNAGTATALQTARTINGTSFDGTANITVTAAAGTLTGTTLNSTVVTSSLTALSTITTGVWQGTVVAGEFGGTGVANTGKTITLGGNLVTSGAFGLTLTLSGTTNVTLPTTGTLATLAGSEALTGKTYNGLTITTSTGTLTVTNGKTASFSNSITFAGTDSTTQTFPSTSQTIVGLTAVQQITSKQILITAAHGTDDTWEGEAITGLNAGATIAQWEAVYLGSSTWLLADANGSSTYPARGLAIAAYSNTNPAVILVRGTVRNDAWSWTVGGAIYLSTTAGGLTQTAPSATTEKIQQVGFALTADIASFDFASGEYLTVQ